MIDIDVLMPWLRVGATLAALAVLFCRLVAMDASTPRAVAWQHEALACALVISLVVPSAVAHALLAAGIALYLGMSAPRWRHGPPWGRDRGTP